MARRAGEIGLNRSADLAAACSFAATSGGPDNKARRGRGTEGSNPSPSSKESATNLTGKIVPALARNRRFESSSLQQTVGLSLDFSFLYRKAGICRGVRGPGQAARPGLRPGNSQPPGSLRDLPLFPARAASRTDPRIEWRSAAAKNDRHHPSQGHRHALAARSRAARHMSGASPPSALRIPNWKPQPIASSRSCAGSRRWLSAPRRSC